LVFKAIATTGLGGSNAKVQIFLYNPIFFGGYRWCNCKMVLSLCCKLTWVMLVIISQRCKPNYWAGIRVQVPGLLWLFPGWFDGDLSILFKPFFVLCENVKKIGGPSSSIVWFPIGAYPPCCHTGDWDGHERTDCYWDCFTGWRVSWWKCCRGWFFGLISDAAV
jgi:hypothetical protein